LTPSFGAYGHYSTAFGDTNPSAGLDDPTFAASFGFYLLAMAVLSFIFALGALRLNICLMIVEWGLTICFALLTATFWHLSKGDAVTAGKCLTVSTRSTSVVTMNSLVVLSLSRRHHRLIFISQAAGAFGFVASSGAWWILAAQILDAVKFPISLPVGDMSSIFPAAKVREVSAV
jgi:succinate-acetate transporter protein